MFSNFQSLLGLCCESGWALKNCSSGMRPVIRETVMQCALPSAQRAKASSYYVQMTRDDYKWFFGTQIVQVHEFDEALICVYSCSSHKVGAPHKPWETTIASPHQA